MHDIRAIRDNPDAFEAALNRRGLTGLTAQILSLDEAREEWEQTRPSDENLVTWAERMQDAPDLMPSTVDLEQKAKDWAVPTWFLEGLVEAEIPRQYLEEHQSLLAEAATIRFLREVR